MRSEVPLDESEPINAYAGGMKQPVDIPPIARASTNTQSYEPDAKIRFATMARRVPMISSNFA